MRFYAALVLIPVLALAAVELGWASRYGEPGSLPALDGPIAADHSNSLVVDIPYGLRSGGFVQYGQPIDPEALLLNTEDGHPRAISYTSWLPSNSITGDNQHAFFRYLCALQRGQIPTPRDLTAAAADARQMHVGWILFWPSSNAPWTLRVPSYLQATGFALDYTADGVSVYRPVASAGRHG
jgi:hypothetical protein